jgi:hypothetical protein
MASVPRAQQVLKDQIGIRPERYAGYHKDLIEILNDALRAIGDSADKTKRRKALADAIKAKASRLAVAGSSE